MARLEQILSQGMELQQDPAVVAVVQLLQSATLLVELADFMVAELAVAPALLVYHQPAVKV
jgi:hypothetical protein